VTEREAPPNLGFDYLQDDPYEDDGWFGREQVTEQPSVDEVPDRGYAQAANNVRQTTYDALHDADPAPSPPTRRLTSPTVNTWTVNGQLRASNNNTLTFRAPPPPWYRTKQARVTLIAVASAAVIVPIVLILWPDSLSTAPGPSTSVAPQPSSTAQPVPSSAPPTPVNVPPPPPPPPQPPPPEDTSSAPSVNQPYWTRPAAPEPTQKPDVGVTRTPVTRAPISVAPQPRQPPNNGATPGDNKRWRPW